MKENSLFKVVAIIAIIIVLLASSVVAIFNGVIELIEETLGNIIDFLSNPLNFINQVGRAIWNGLVSRLPINLDYNFDAGETATVFLDSELVDTLADSLSSGGKLTDNSEYYRETQRYGDDTTMLKGSLDLEKTGLTKDNLRDLVLAGYVTQATTDTMVGIEWPEDEINADLKDKLLDYVKRGNIPIIGNFNFVIGGSRLANELRNG